MKTLSFYFSRIFLKWFSQSFLGLCLVIVLFDFSELQRRASTRLNIDFLTKLSLVFMKLPFLMQQLLPFVVFISSMIAIFQLNRYSELTILRAAGISIWRSLLPFVSVAFLLAAGDLYFIDPLSTRLMTVYEKADEVLFQKGTDTQTLGQTGIWVRHQTNKEIEIVHIKKTEGPLLHNVSLYTFDEKGNFIKRLYGAQGSFEGTNLHLKKVWMLNQETKPLPSLTLPTSLTLEKIKDSSVNPSALSFWSLGSFIDLLEKSGLSKTRYLMQWHSLLAKAFWLGGMVLLAAAFCLRQLRRGKTVLLIIAGTLTGFALYFIRDMSHALGLSGATNPIIAAWTPCVLTYVVGITLLLYQEEG